MTSHVPLGDSKHGGALFLLPREIRDEIYRLLVKGSYIDTGCFYRYVYAHTEAPLDFAVLQLSKSVGREATEILYSESVFRFVISEMSFGEHILPADLDRMKRLAPMIQNVILDVRFKKQNTFYEMNMGIAVQNFGGLAIMRRSLLFRILVGSTSYTKGKGLPRICQQLKAFVGFRAATLEVLPVESLLRILLDCPSTYGAIFCRRIRKNVARIAQAVAEELERVLGPAVSGFRFDAGNMPLLRFNFSKVYDPTLISYLEFHSNKHTVDNQVVKEDQV